MDPEVPWEDQREPSGAAKLEAAATAFTIMVLAAVGIIMTVTIVTALWHVGIVNTVFIIGIFSGLLAIGRALYRTILEKDFL